MIQPRGIFLSIAMQIFQGEAGMMYQFKSALQRSRERARHRRNYRALLALEDHFLDDIGLSRDEVRGMMSSDRFA